MNVVRKAESGGNGTALAALPFKSADWYPTLCRMYVNSIDGWIDNDVRLPDVACNWDVGIVKTS